MGDVLRGTPWEIFRTFLSPDVLMQLRTTARYWNKGDKYGPYGDFFLFLLKSGEEDASTAPVKGTAPVSIWGLQATYVWGHITCIKAVPSGEAWINIRQGLFPDDVVKLRATARCWNNGELYGDFGDFFFMLLNMKQYTSCEGGRAPLRLRHPFMETIRLRGLVRPSGDTMDDTTFSNILTAWGNGRW